MTNKTKKAIEKISKNVMDYKTRQDQIEIIDMSTIDLRSISTPIKSLIEKIVTNGTDYIENSPALWSRPKSDYLALKKSFQRYSHWSDEKFEKQQGKFIPPMIREISLQIHLLGMESRTQDKIKEKELRKILSKYFEFTSYNTTLTNHFRNGKDGCYPTDLARYELSEMLKRVNKEDAVRFFKILEHCKNENELMKTMGLRY